MASIAGEGSAMDRLAYRIGYASARLDELAQAARRIADGEPFEEVAPPRGARERRDWSEVKRRAGRGERRGERSGSRIREPDDPPAGAELAAQAAFAALASRILSPDPVNWPRAVAAGTLGALVSDLIDRLELRTDGRKFSTSIGLRPALDADEAFPSWLRRCATGIVLASLYARYAYGRLPGPPLARGLAFGALEAATARAGGAAALLAQLGSELPFPFDQLADGEDASPERAVARMLAFGAVMGIVYRE